MMRLLYFLLAATVIWGCNKTEKNYSCGVNPELNVQFDGGFVALANVFTPDGDGVDEAFGPVSYGLSSFRLVVYGEDDKVVFESTDFSKWWDGRVEGAVKSGAYKYAFESSTSKGETISKTGTVCVITPNTQFCYQSFSGFRFISLYSNGVFGDPSVYLEKYNKCD